MSGRLLTAVMYHYVRPIAGSRYPGIKGLEARAFEGQLDYLQRHYRIVSPSDVLACLKEGRPLPDRAALLTFDDGYKDHVRHVYPALRARGLSGVFFPPTSAVCERELLDVNRIHFILACAPIGELVGRMEDAVRGAGSEFALDSLEEYRGSLRVANRFDDADVIYFKRMLQHALPEALRNRIARELFARHVSADEKGFCDELYASGDDLREMAAGGMEIGSHGHRHYWLARLDPASQARDIDRSLALLGSLGLCGGGFWFCYPYGSYDAETLRILRGRNCGAAVTVAAGLAECRPEGALELARLDTNDLPRARDAALSPWTGKVLAGGAPAAMERQ